MLFGPGPRWCEGHPQTNKKAYLFFLIPAHSHLTAHSISMICAMLSTMHGSSSSQFYYWTHWDKNRVNHSFLSSADTGSGGGVECVWGCFLYHSATVRTLSVTSPAVIPQGAVQLGLPRTCFVRVPGSRVRPSLPVHSPEHANILAAKS